MSSTKVLKERLRDDDEEVNAGPGVIIKPPTHELAPDHVMVQSPECHPDCEIWIQLADIVGFGCHHKDHLLHQPLEYNVMVHMEGKVMAMPIKKRCYEQIRSLFVTG